jgi:ABC-type nitrate/sulfonate/bicarbonate transport system substrate-binding protein
MKTWKERPAVVQKVVAALAETVHFVERNPEAAMAAVGKNLRLNDADALRSAYEAYARNLINRRMIVPPKLVSETLEIAKQDGAAIRKKPGEIFDNSFVENLEKSGFMKEVWGGTLPGERTTP